MRGWLLRWFPFATRAGRAFGERFTPLGKWLLATAAIAGIFSADPTRTHAFLLFGATGALLAVAFFGSLAWRPRVQARRVLPASATQGETTIYFIELHTGDRALGACRLADRLRLRYPTREEFAAEIHDAPEDNWFDRRVGFLRWQRLRQRLQGATLATTSVPALPPRTSTRVALEIAPLRRGWLSFDAVRLLQPDPLGLCYAVVTLPLTDRLLSRPAVIPMPAFSLPPPAARRRAAGQARQRGEGLEFFALREYRPGDPPKHIDWRSSARRAQPIVRQFAAPVQLRPRLLVDPAAARRAPSDFEHMLSVAASLFVAAHAGGPVSLHLLGSEQGPATTPGDALDTLALLSATPEDTLPLWPAALAAADGLPLVLVCARWDDARAACVEAALKTSDVLVLCTDPRAVDAPGVVRITAPAAQLPVLAWPAISQRRAS
ncbi:MAG TPA: DUF58 domain-containing protein [Gammaproteobacteria bacterium]|nr:DUF58 domain-containing protein [Gammaproteobacteria bacterium]